MLFYWLRRVRAMVSNSKFSWGQVSITRGLHYEADATMTVPEPHYLLETTLTSLFPAKGIVDYRQIVSNRLYVLLKGTCSLADRALSNTGEYAKLNNWNVNHLKIAKSIAGRTKCPRGLVDRVFETPELEQRLCMCIAGSGFHFSEFEIYNSREQCSLQFFRAARKVITFTQ